MMGMNNYIMNRESLKRHCEAMCKKFKDAPTSGTYSEHRLVLDLLEQTRWIPVSERLPEEIGFHIVTTKVELYNLKPHYETNIVWFDGEEFFTGYIGDGYSIIAWMPRPQPYKEESEEV